MRLCLRVTVVLAVMLAYAPAEAQTAQDSAAIRSTALDYIDGYWSGDAQRMASALHPELVKRIRGADPSTGREWIDDQGASRLVRGTARGGGRETPRAGAGARRRARIGVAMSEYWTSSITPRASVSTPAYGSTTCTW